MLRVRDVHVLRHKVLVEGLSQRQAARELGVSRNTVRRYLVWMPRLSSPAPAVLDSPDPFWRRSCEDDDSGMAKEG